ncbi:MAG: SufS family cysteine desulfurase [bacterium]
MEALAEKQAPQTAKRRTAEAVDVERIRNEFPILQQVVHGHPLVYLDNAATAQKPRVVIEAINDYYHELNANIHRGVHYLSERATLAYEDARTKVKGLINAESEKEIIFVRGTTEGINLVATAFGRKNLREGDEIVISTMEHHSNIVPWQILCEQTGAKLKIIPINDRGEIIYEAFESLLNARTRLVALVHVSNSLGTINPVRKVIELAHQQNVPVLLDGAQAVPHKRVDVQELDCDFYAFSGHKLFGPTGIGVLYGKEALLESMPPYQGGGDMIKSVTFEKTIYNELPNKFEAGTPNIAGAIGLGRAIEFVMGVGFANIAAYEQALLKYATAELSELEPVRIIGTAREKAAVVSFIIEGIHPHDVGTILDQHGIAVRTGHHCTQPIMQRFNVPATTRASFAFYNTQAEIDQLVAGIKNAIELFN